MLNYYRQATQFAFESGIIAKKLDPESLFEPKFLKAALQDLKLQQFWAPVASPLAKR